VYNSGPQRSQIMVAYSLLARSWSSTCWCGVGHIHLASFPSLDDRSGSAFPGSGGSGIGINNKLRLGAAEVAQEGLDHWMCSMCSSTGSSGRLISLGCVLTVTL
jgi:hypothetical protein